MGPFIYVLISAIAVFPALFVFKITMERIKSGEGSIEKAQMQFFLWIAIIEVIPIILFVYAFSSDETVASFEDLIVPGLLVLVFMGVNALFTLLQGKIDVPEELKGRIQTFSLIGLAMINAIPIMSIVGLIVMAQ